MPSTLAHAAQDHREPRNPQTCRRLFRGDWCSPTAGQTPDPVPTGPKLQGCSTEFQRKSKGLCPGYSLRICNMVSGAEGSSHPELGLLCLPALKGERPGGPTSFLQRHEEKNKGSTDSSSFHTHQEHWTEGGISDVQTEAHRGGVTCGGHTHRR